MSPSFLCKCGKQLLASAALAGKQVRCPACGALLPVPAAAAGQEASLRYQAVEVQPRRTASPPPAPAEGSWHYVKDRQSRGPLSLAQLRQLCTSGQVAPADLVWKPGMAYWTAARDVPELFPTSPPPIPSPPRPAPVRARAGEQPHPGRMQASGAMESPVTNAGLPFMANLICVYCLVVHPLLWVVGNVSCCLVGRTFHEDSAFAGLDVLHSVVDAVVGLGLAGLLVWGGWQLRSLRASGRAVVLIGLWASLGYGLLSCSLGLSMTVAALAQEEEQLAESTAGGTIVAFFLISIALAELAFQVLALVWLTRQGKHLPLADSGLAAALPVSAPSSRPPEEIPEVSPVDAVARSGIPASESVETAVQAAGASLATPSSPAPARTSRPTSPKTSSASSWHPAWGMVLLAVALGLLKVGGCIPEDFRTPFDRNPSARIAGEVSAANPIILTAQVLDQEYRANAIVAEQKYKGKVLEITGTVTRIQGGTTGLLGSKPCLYLGGFQCLFQDDSTIKQLAAGQPVTIRGKYKGGRVIEYCMLR